MTKQDIIEATGSLQVCTGSKSGSEAAIHAMHNIFEADNTDAVLLIDASNAFNSLNRALHNVRVLCPTIATCAINTYREPERLFIIGGKELRSEEGTTQGDPLAMCLYAVSLQPSIAPLNASTFVKQVPWGKLKKWCGVLNESGPDLGYFPNAKKCWLIVKPEKEEAARDLFGQTSINISTQGQKHLGAVYSAQDLILSEKVDDWVGQVVKLAELTANQPQACYAAYTFSLKHKGIHYVRT